MDKRGDKLDAFAQALGEAGVRLAVAKPADLNEAATLLRTFGQDVIAAAELIGYASGGGGGLEKIKKIVADE